MVIVNVINQALLENWYWFKTTWYSNSAIPCSFRILIVGSSGSGKTTSLM
jgi:ABC-type lipoprotein export system ATPase subunit